MDFNFRNKKKKIVMPLIKNSIFLNLSNNKLKNHLIILMILNNLVIMKITNNKVKKILVIISNKVIKVGLETLVTFHNLINPNNYSSNNNNLIILRITKTSLRFNTKEVYLMMMRMINL